MGTKEVEELWGVYLFTHHLFSRYYGKEREKCGSSCSLTLRETTGMFSPNIQNQHKVFLKLCRLLDSLFEAISLQAKNITQLLIHFIGKQAGNGSFPTLDHCRPDCRRGSHTFHCKIKH